MIGPRHRHHGCRAADASRPSPSRTCWCSARRTSCRLGGRKKESESGVETLAVCDARAHEKALAGMQPGTCFTRRLRKRIIIGAGPVGPFVEKGQGPRKETPGTSASRLRLWVGLLKLLDGTSRRQRRCQTKDRCCWCFTHRVLVAGWPLCCTPTNEGARVRNARRVRGIHRAAARVLRPELTGSPAHVPTRPGGGSCSPN